MCDDVEDGQEELALPNTLVSHAPRVVPPSQIRKGHPDYEQLEAVKQDIQRRIPDLADAFPELALQALEFVLDPIRTGRNRLAQLDNVEKTFIGLKVEHFLRDALQAPKGIRDLVLAGKNVDVKNTVGDKWSWMIPPETYRDNEPCLLAALDAPRREVWLGLLAAREEYLGANNRDSKRGILTGSYQHILWLVERQSLPPDRWEGIDMARFRELRQVRGGNNRVVIFFEENLRRPVHRTVVQALLHDQLDYMKRLRGNGGAKDVLRDRRIALLSGTYFNPLLESLGIGRIQTDEHIAVEARTPQEERILTEAGEL